MDCRTLIAHPKLPILHVLTADGRVLVIAISVKVKGQLISKYPFGVIVWTKIPTKFFPGFLP